MLGGGVTQLVGSAGLAGWLTAIAGDAAARGNAASNASLKV
jgi:hypothetical protein